MMEAKTKKGLIVTGVVVGVVAVLYLLFNKKGKSTLTELQDIVWQNLVKNIPDIAPYKSNYMQTGAFNNLEYMNAWATSIKNNLPTFTYNNVEYRTKDGIASTSTIENIFDGITYGWGKISGQIK